jgi:hypothetical protein
MCDDVLQVLKQIVLDNELDYFADWGNLAKESFPYAMNDSHFLPEIRNLLRGMDDGTLGAELHDLYANILSQLISLLVEHSFTMQMFIDPTPAKCQSKEATLSYSENLSSAETSLSELYVSDVFSDHSQQQDKLMEDWAAQQSSKDDGNLQEQANANNGIKFDNINIGKEEKSLEDNKEVEEDDNSFRAQMQREATTANRIQNSTIARRQCDSQEG